MRTPLSSRRVLAAAVGLLVGLGGPLALTTAPAQAHNGEDHHHERTVNCQSITLLLDRHNKETQDPDDLWTSRYPWRLVLLPAGGSPLILWQSGDWPADADLGDDVDAIDQEWIVELDELDNGFLEIIANVEGIPNGAFRAEYWDFDDAEPGWGEYHLGKLYEPQADGTLDRHSEWEYQIPCADVGEIDFTPPTCDTPGSLTIPSFAKGDDADDLTYTVNGQEFAPGVYDLPLGTYEIHGLRLGHHKDYEKRWTIEPPDCPSPSPGPTPMPTPTPEPSPGPSDEPGGEGGGLPVTGASTGIAAGIAVGLLALGGGLYLVARRRRTTFSA